MQSSSASLVIDGVINKRTYKQTACLLLQVDLCAELCTYSYNKKLDVRSKRTGRTSLK